MSKKGINGRVKGNAAEREVAGFLQEWWARLEPACEFCRTPLSGGWSTGNVRAHFAACGDVMTTASAFPFCVEVKRREQWSPGNFMDGKPTPPWGWWGQTIKAANVQSAVPMMWLRKNRLPPEPGTSRAFAKKFPWIVVVPRDFMVEKRLSSPDIVWTDSQLKSNGVDYSGVLPVGYLFDRFLEMAPNRMRLPKDA